MSRKLYARAKVIEALCGFSSWRVRRDIKLYKIPSKTRRESPLKYYDLAAFEKTLGYQFTEAQINSVVERLTRPVVIEDN
ncbi:hypothetical protein HYPP_02378 [Hyphomicrobium sp. ghe19]|nr:hypothetical protein HYPP_02378 [Hyphomicrobium sp. ghe19]